MRFRIIWAILALIVSVPGVLLGQAVVNAPKVMCLCPDTVKKPVVAKPKAASKPVVKRLSNPPAAVVRKDTTLVKTVITEKVVVATTDTMNLHVFGKIELALTNADRTAMTQSQKQVFDGEAQRQRSWLSQHWRWPVATAIIGTAVGAAGNHYGWWGHRNITQCAFVDSPGAVCPSK